MFTGIVETTGEVANLKVTEAGGRLELKIPFARELELGESVAVNGCCLTVAAADEANEIISFDLLQETLRLTNLGDLRPGDPVNLERALRADARLGGHFVQGHVDATAELLDYSEDGQDHRLKVALPQDFARYVISKGSITVDGMSLTVALLEEDSFTIWITPHTHAVTNLRIREKGQRVNMEFDVLAKYMERLTQFGMRD